MRTGGLSSHLVVPKGHKKPLEKAVWRGWVEGHTDHGSRIEGEGQQAWDPGAFGVRQNIFSSVAYY